MAHYLGVLSDKMSDKTKLVGRTSCPSVYLHLSAYKTVPKLFEMTISILFEIAENAQRVWLFGGSGHQAVAIY